MLDSKNIEKTIKNRQLLIKKKYNEKNKEQITSWQKEYYENNKEYIAAKTREKKYGISPEDYDTMLKEQDNKCKICLVSFTTLKPQLIHVDHCHTTNQIRGLLCVYCNSGLGFFKDNTETLTNAIVYLEHTQE